MASEPRAVYADHSFPITTTPIFQKKKNNPNMGKPDVFDTISTNMVLAHNIITRGLNSIYLQAPHITPPDEAPFCQYMLSWHTLMRTHHAGEELDFFPAVEEMASVKGIMQANVEQHHTFEAGVEEFGDYVESLVNGKEKYDGGRIMQIIDGFGGALMKHFAEEIPTLEALRVYGEDKMGGMLEVADKEAKKSMKALGVAGLVWCFANIDTQCEDGLWANFPPAPFPVRLIVTSVLWRLHGSMVKFSACDSQGKMRPLYAISRS